VEAEFSPVCDWLPSGVGLVIEKCGVADAQAEGVNDEEGVAVGEGPVADAEGETGMASPAETEQAGCAEGVSGPLTDDRLSEASRSVIPPR